MSQVGLFRGELQALDDSGDLQLAQILGYAGEQLTGVHRVQPFGLSSNPPPGSHGIGLRLRGSSDLAAILGVENAAVRQKNTPIGGTCLYDQWGNVVSLVMSEMRIVHATQIHLVAPTIILEGTVKLGGPDASKPAAMQGTTDTAGNADTGNLATMVLVK